MVAGGVPRWLGPCPSTPNPSPETCNKKRDPDRGFPGHPTVGGRGGGSLRLYFYISDRKITLPESLVVGIHTCPSSWVVSLFICLNVSSVPSEAPRVRYGTSTLREVTVRVNTSSLVRNMGTDFVRNLHPTGSLPVLEPSHRENSTPVRHQ